MSKLHLDLKDRIILRNQYLTCCLLEQVLEVTGAPRDPSLGPPVGSEDYAKVIRVLEAGLEGEYESIGLGLTERPVPRAVCEEVHEILTMFRHLHDSREKVVGQLDFDVTPMNFGGFDRNRESDHYRYGVFLNQNEGYIESRVVDSHSPRLEAYRRMLRAWEPFRANKHLNADQIRDILAAYPHPQAPGRAEER